MQSGDETKEPNLSGGDLITAVDNGSITDVVSQGGSEAKMVGRLPSQGAFTREGIDLCTGEPRYEIAGAGKVHR
jgi:hypothetical protein